MTTIAPPARQPLRAALLEALALKALEQIDDPTLRALKERCWSNVVG